MSQALQQTRITGLAAAICLRFRPRAGTGHPPRLPWLRKADSGNADRGKSIDRPAA